MSYIIKASALSNPHIGQLVTVKQGEFTITDRLAGVAHAADLISEPRIGVDATSYSLGRTRTTLAFANAGDVQVHGDSDVTVAEDSK